MFGWMHSWFSNSVEFVNQFQASWNADEVEADEAASRLRHPAGKGRKPQGDDLMAVADAVQERRQWEEDLITLNKLWALPSIERR